MLRRAFWSAAAARVLAVFGIASAAKASEPLADLKVEDVYDSIQRLQATRLQPDDPTLCGVWEEHSDLYGNCRVAEFSVTSNQGPPAIPSQVFDYCPAGFVKVRWDFVCDEIVLSKTKVAYTIRGTIEYIRVKNKEDSNEQA